MLQYVSAFDDEIQEAHEEQVEETAPQNVSEGAEEMPEGSVEDKPVEETTQSGQNEATPPQNSNHGPFYYFYQGVYVMSYRSTVQLILYPAALFKKDYPLYIIMNLSL